MGDESTHVVQNVRHLVVLDSPHEEEAEANDHRESHIDGRQPGRRVDESRNCDGPGREDDRHRDARNLGQDHGNGIPTNSTVALDVLEVLGMDGGDDDEEKDGELGEVLPMQRL